MTTPPIHGFVAFAASRILDFRSRRERAWLESELKTPRKRSVSLGPDGSPTTKSKRSTDAKILASLPAGLDARTRELVLAALKKH